MVDAKPTINPARYLHGLTVIMIKEYSLLFFAGFAMVDAKPTINPARIQHDFVVRMINVVVVQQDKLIATGYRCNKQETE